VIKNCWRCSVRGLRGLHGLGLLLALLAACTGTGAEPDDTYQGTIELEERVLGFEAPGRVQSIEVYRGQVVEAGAVLARLDPSLEELAAAARAAEAAAAAAQADLVREGARDEDVRAIAARVRAAQAAENLVRRDLEREAALQGRGVTPTSVVKSLEGQLERAIAERQALEHQLRGLREGARPPELAGAEARARAAQIAHEIEQKRLERYVLRAHEPGTVLDVHAERGEVVATGTPVVTLADRTRPYADVFVPQADLGGIDVGDPAEVRVDAYAQTFRGHVERISPKTEFTPRFLFSERERPNLVVRVRVRIDDPDGALHAGVPAFVAVDRTGRAAPPGPAAPAMPATPATPAAPRPETTP
jgi:HlyD family secretion protein